MPARPSTNTLAASAPERVDAAQAHDSPHGPLVISAYASLGVLLLGYLLGSIPFGLLLTRAAGLGDVRKIGSGNIGATNVLRTGNKGLAAATLLLECSRARPPC